MDWGFEIGKTACEKHFQNKKKQLGLKGDVAVSYIEDYAKISIMMEEKKEVQKCLHELAQELGHRRSGIQKSVGELVATQSREGYVRLSEALAEYEKLCWFPPSHELFIDFVPPDDFMKYIANGLMPKDPGAGYKHGDFTHRLHWHAISRVITNRFKVAKSAAWNHTPLDLYTSLGQGQALAAKMWFQLLDDNSKPDFRSPDKLHEHVREGDYGVLSSNVAHRYEKRKAEFDAHFNQQDFEKADSSVYREFHGKKRNEPAIYNLQTQGKAGAVYKDKKMQHSEQGLFKSLSPSILKKKDVAVRVRIGARIAASKGDLCRVDAVSQDYLVHNAVLGMVTRQGGKVSRGMNDNFTPIKGPPVRL
jgi:hypothetical protein